MGQVRPNEFVVNSKGHCFFCLNRIPVIKLESMSAQFETYSIHHLSRFLKMDMRKVFIFNEEQIPLQLQDKVRCSKLKVHLCEGCALLSEKSSEINRKIEKLEMEMKDCLELIHGKFLEASEIRKLEELRDFTNYLKFNSDASMEGILEVVDALRKEAIHKCTQKLTGIRPRVKVENLSKKGISRARAAFKLRTSSEAFRNLCVPDCSETTPLATNTGLKISETFKSSGALPLANITEFEKIELESSTMQFLSEEDDNISYFSDGNNCLQSDTIGGDVEIVREEMDSDGVADDSNVGTSTIIEKKPLINSALSSSTSSKNAKLRECSINPDTGTHKCNHCNQDFNCWKQFSYHFDIVHLKIRYKCFRCGKLFTRKSNLRQHQRTTSCSDLGGPIRKHKCHLCTKAFTGKRYLSAHLEGVHYKLREYDCTQCGKKFNTKCSLWAHQKRVKHKRI